MVINLYYFLRAMYGPRTKYLNAFCSCSIYSRPMAAQFSRFLNIKKSMHPHALKGVI